MSYLPGQQTFPPHATRLQLEASSQGQFNQHAPSQTGWNAVVPERGVALHIGNTDQDLVCQFQWNYKSDNQKYSWWLVRVNTESNNLKCFQSQLRVAPSEKPYEHICLKIGTSPLTEPNITAGITFGQ